MFFTHCASQPTVMRDYASTDAKVASSRVLVLKKIDSKSLQVDLRLFREMEKAWKEIEGGKSRKASRKRFLDELRTW